MFGLIFLPILAPFWARLGLPFVAKIANKGATLKEEEWSWRKLRAQGAQGRDQTLKTTKKEASWTSKMTPEWCH